MVQESTNTFSDGLIKDLNPITTPNTVLTDALNATLLTFNGNELVLQNDMGNTTIEEAKLSDGFIPIGVKEYGGILYILSHNPQTNETEIGSFPSPQEVSEEHLTPILINIELDEEGLNLNKNFIISEKNLNAGDAFIIFLKNPNIIKDTIPYTYKYLNHLGTITGTIETNTNYIANSYTLDSGLTKIYVNGISPNLPNYPLAYILDQYGVILELIEIGTGNIYHDFEINLPLNYKYIMLNGDINNPPILKSFLSTSNDIISEYISSFIDRKFYKIKLISIENGIEYDITSTLSNQWKLINNSNFEEQDFWFVPLVNENFPSDLDLKKYVDEKHIQRYKARKRGKLAIRLELENIDEFRIQNSNESNYPILFLENNGINFYLQFNFYIKSLATLKPNSIKIDITLIDPDGKIPDEQLNTSYISDIDFSNYNEITKSIDINIGESYNKIAIYTITPYNDYYNVIFNDFIISDIIDLSKDPESWINSHDADYNFYDYDLRDYETI